MNSETQDMVGLVFWLIGNAIALLLFVAPMITFKKIIRNKSTKEFSGIPYVLTLLNCLITGGYSAFMFGGIISFVLNMAGAVLELIYVIIFLVFAQKREKKKISGILTLVLALFTAIALISVFWFKWPQGSARVVSEIDKSGARVFCGFAYVMSSIAMYASPLSITRMVIRTKSTEFMPFFLSLFVFFYATSWFIAGLLQRDPFLAVSGGFGSVLGILQLILYARYHSNPVEKYRFAKGALDIGLSQLQNQPDLKRSTSQACLENERK